MVRMEALKHFDALTVRLCKEKHFLNLNGCCGADVENTLTVRSSKAFLYSI